MANPSTAAAPPASGARAYFDRIADVNRDLIELWSETAETYLDASAKLGKDVVKSWANALRSAQAATLKSYQTGAKLFERAPSE